MFNTQDEHDEIGTTTAQWKVRWGQELQEVLSSREQENLQLNISENLKKAQATQQVLRMSSLFKDILRLKCLQNFQRGHVM